MIEASKVRNYHSTLLDGFVRGYRAAGLEKRFGVPVLYAHHSFFDCLSSEVRSAVEHRPIPVMDQDKRRLVRKSILEAWVVLRALLKLRRNETLLVTTILPSAMILVELLRWIVPGRRLVILQHGELEGAWQKHRQRLGSFGFYILLWLRLRRVHSATQVAVLDRFIADAVRSYWPDAIRADQLFVLPLPVAARPFQPHRPGPLRCCFVGFDTPNKGFPVYERLAHSHPNMEFRVIGAGIDRKVEETEGRALDGAEGFMDAVAACDVAVFPYVDGYSCSLSAAATDAIAAGLHLLASDRGCFVALREALGPDFVTICATEESMRAQLDDPAWLQFVVANREARLARIGSSRYGPASVGSALSALMTPAASWSAKSEALA